MKKRILLCTALLAMSCIIFSCKKEKGVNDSATESKVIAITETKEVDTTVAKKNVETKNQIYTDEQISEAEKVASDYYKNHICLFDYLFISSQMSAKPYFIGSTGILLLW